MWTRKKLWPCQAKSNVRPCLWGVGCNGMTLRAIFASMRLRTLRLRWIFVIREHTNQNKNKRRGSWFQAFSLIQFIIFRSCRSELNRETSFCIRWAKEILLSNVEFLSPLDVLSVFFLTGLLWQPDAKPTKPLVTNKFIRWFLDQHMGWSYKFLILWHNWW